jgi:eukaryotic-like serine/threonine-protein kinase
MTGARSCCMLEPAAWAGTPGALPSAMPDVDIHSRPTRVVRMPVVCGNCVAEIAGDAQYCVMCGEWIRRSVSSHPPVIGDYLLEHALHESAASTTYRARYRPSGECVALKVLHPDLARDPVQVSRFRREARCLYRLRSAHTVKAYDHGATPSGLYFIAMELLEGERLDLHVLRRGGGLPWREALHIQRSICVALIDAHDHGIVHRGIRPSHVMLGADRSVTLLDFGLARHRADDPEDDPSYPDHGMGTPLRYLAPAQRDGAPADPPGDCYALAVMTLELILGRERIIGGPPVVLPPEVPLAVERLLLRCVAGTSVERLASAGATVSEIDRICAVEKPDLRVLAHTPAFELEPPRFLIVSARA